MLTVHGTHQGHGIPTRNINRINLNRLAKKDNERSKSVGSVYTNSVIELNNGVNLPSSKSLSSTLMREKSKYVPSANAATRDTIVIKSIQKFRKRRGKLFTQHVTFQSYACYKRIE